MSSSFCRRLPSNYEATRNYSTMTHFPRPCFTEKGLDVDHINEDSNNVDKKKPNPEMGCWNFLQSLSGSDQHRAKTECSNEIYVHPLVKRSASKLSEKSLEMCTESLGSETGSKSGDDMSLLAVKARKSLKPQAEDSNSKKTAATDSFPPPITSLSGSSVGGVRVMQHREKGRLVLEAVTVAAPAAWFVAERSEGRLRLRLTNSYTSEEKESVNQDGEFIEGDDEEDEEKDVNTEGRVGNGKVRRLSRRCKEGGPEQNGLLNWEQFLVAPS